MHSHKRDSFFKIELAVVLILVVMEDALALEKLYKMLDNFQAS